MLRSFFPLAIASIALAGMGCAVPAEARIYFDSTRIIFPGQDREVTVRVSNEAENPSLVQAWISEDVSSSAPSAVKAPFVLRPPVFRLDGGKGQVMRILHTGEPLPEDRESLFWLNAREVPASSREEDGSQRMLHLILNKKMKLLYRPKGLRASGASAAPKDLQWSVVQAGQNWELQAHNRSPYFVNVNSVETATGKIDVGTGAVPPLGTARYQLSHAQHQALGQQLKFEYITDLGAVRSITLPLSRP